MSAEVRAIEVIDLVMAGLIDPQNGAPEIAAALAAAGLLVTDEQARLIRLGQAVETVHAKQVMKPAPSWSRCMNSIRAEAERGGQ